MKKVFYPLIVFLFGTYFLFAQQEPHFTHFMYNQQAVNPAFVGSRNTPSFHAIYRNQWVDFEGAPTNIALGFSTPFAAGSSGFGIYAANQAIGASNNWFTNLAYSYRMKISDDLALRVGIQAAGLFSSINFAHQGHTNFDPEPELNGAFSNLNFNAGGGLYLHSKKFYVGFSVPYFLSNDITSTNTGSVSIPHLYGMAGLLLPAGPKVMVRPALLVKYANTAIEKTPLDFDLNLSLIFSNRLSVGASYRHEDSIDFLLFLQAGRKFGFGVGYDYTTSALSNYNSGTFEVMMRFDLKSEREDIENPRFFL